MKTLAFSLIFYACAALGGEFQLKERIQKANSNDYIVTEANKMITVVAIRSSNQNCLIFEEISIPTESLKNRPASWAQWIKNKAPGHTSWSMIEIDLQNGQLLECYSFSRGAWLNLTRQESLLSSLLGLKLKPVDPNKRRRIGPPPNPGEIDVRKIWNPPLIFQGERIENNDFEVFEAQWPEDGTELSGKTVSLYFDREKRFPLPFWVQVDTTHASIGLRAIDSGKNLPMTHSALPRRVPEFIGNPQKTENGLRLSLKSPKYYREFELFAIDITGKEKQIYPVTRFLTQRNEEFLNLEIDQEQLQLILEPEHRYKWLLIPVGHSESYTESNKSFIWSDSRK